MSNEVRSQEDLLRSHIKSGSIGVIRFIVWGDQERFGNGAVMEHFFIPNPSGFDIINDNGTLDSTSLKLLQKQY
ncbi:hypothetical protein D5R40_24610 [Okeania hirsuta]|uniref:Uncharacterized protein n=1 Tax=Okeania hirsuta TaxID=1458930 RepID=A0A3N6P5K0_9CYAN|nr:hypothetical protein D5R40_24610 [Okeania hirsuta]